MTLSELSIKRPVFAWMLMAGLIVFGAVSFMRMGISQLPDVDFPVVTINIRLEGAAPEVIETEIVDFVEDAVMGIEGAQQVTSRSENSEGTITVQFDLSRNIDLAVQDVQAKLSQVQSKLPREITAITVSKTNPEDQPILLITLESDRYPLRELMYYVNDRLKDQFAMVPGVGDIALNGYVNPNLRIWVSNEKLRKFQLDVTDVVNAVQNEHSEPPAGKVEDAAGKRQYYVRTLGEATSVQDFSNIVINERGGVANFRPIRLKEVARVENGTADVLSRSRARGTPGVGLGILKQRGTNAVEVGRALRAKIGEIQKTLPEGMKLGINYDATKYIEEAVRELNFTLLLSALLTAVVCWTFLGSWSSTINVLFSIPTSVVGTFIVLYFSGFTLNTFTLLGLSLSIGIVVDDAIMVLENIIRHQEKGKDRESAALIGSREITFAALAATVSIVAIFLPVIFMKGIIGKFFFQFGVTITAAVLLSLLEALTLTPMRCSQFVATGERATRVGRAIENTLSAITRFYAQTLSRTLDFKYLVIVGSALLFVGSLFCFTLLNKEFLPAEDQSRFLVRFKTPVGSALGATDSTMRLVEDFLSKRPEVDRYVMQVGGGSPGDSNRGSVLVTMKSKGSRGTDPRYQRELSQQDFMSLCRDEFKKIPSLSVSVQDLSIKSFTASRGFPVEFTVQGPEWDQLAKFSEQIVSELDKSGFVTDLDTDYIAKMPEFQIVPNRVAASVRGVSILRIGQTINAMIGGVLVGRYPQGGHRYDIRVALDETHAEPIEKMNSLQVRNNRGELVPLSEIASVVEKKSMSEINRSNRERSITVYANVRRGKSQQMALAKVEEIAHQLLPPQYHVRLSGSSQTFNESFQSLMLALILGLFVAYMVLASQFNSFFDPLTVLVALPFSVSGAFAALLIAHQSINIYSLIGLVLLMGIVKKNSILLVDFANQIRERDKLSPHEAILAASPVRLRPILMTSVACVAGAIPAAIGLGPGAESRVPMAVTIIGGVAVSTLLTLYVVPCVYLVMKGRKLGSAPTRSSKPKESAAKAS